MRARVVHAAKTSSTGRVVFCLLVCALTQPGLAGDEGRINLTIQDNQVQIGTDVARPFYIQWRSPSRDWVNWTETTLPDPEEPCVWMRAIFEPDDPFQWEIPADVNSVYTPSVQPAAAGTFSWVPIGEFSANGSVSLITPSDLVLAAAGGDAPANPIPDSPATSPQNNQAMATPRAGTAQLLWRNPSSGIVSRWDLADTTGTNFVIRYYDRIRLLPSMDAVSLDSTWTLACIAALDSDGIRNDMIWHHSSSGRFSLWRVNDDPTIGTYGPILYEASPGVWTNVSLASPWRVVGVASLDSDGLLNDVIWQNTTLGIVSRWEVGADGRIARYGRMKYESTPGNWTDVSMPSPWTLGTVAALETDGLLNDFIWQHPTYGTFSFWKVDTNAYVASFGPIRYESSPGNWTNANMKSPWLICGACELDNDDKVNDVIWQHPQAGYVSRWDVGTNGYVSTFGRIKYQSGTNWVDISMTTPWSMRGVAALNGDLKLNDLVWHHPTLGRFSCWRLTVVSGEVRISDYAPFMLDGQHITLASPWQISAVRGY